MGENQTGWTRHGERLVYDNKWVQVSLVDIERPDGQREGYHVVHLDPIAVAVLVDAHQRVLMLWRYRFPVDQWGYELPGGLVERGETAAAAAARETPEETGWRPLGTPQHLVRFEPLPGQLTAPVDAFLWRRAERVGEPTVLEEAERLEWVPLNRIPDLARRRELLGAGRWCRCCFTSSTAAQRTELVQRTGCRMSRPRGAGRGQCVAGNLGEAPSRLAALDEPHRPQGRHVTLRRCVTREASTSAMTLVSHSSQTTVAALLLVA